MNMTTTLRKILTIGGSKAVTIPSEWLRAQGLKARDSVAVVELDPSHLMISATKSKETRK